MIEMTRQDSRVDTHHLLWRRKAWNSRSELHRKVRLMRPYTVGLRRYWHDEIHAVVEPLSPPTVPVAKLMGEIGLAHGDWNDDFSRMEVMLDEMAGVVRTERPEIADGMVNVMSHITAQLGIMSLAKSLENTGGY